MEYFHLVSESTHRVKVPPEWAQKFADHGIELLDHQLLREGERSWAWALYKARLKSDDDKASSVSFEVAQTQCSTTERSVHIGRRLANLGSLGLLPLSHICFPQEIHAFEDTTFALVPSMDTTLEVLLDEMSSMESTLVVQKETMLLPYSRSLQILADILRGVLSLEKAGVVHFELTPWNIFLKDGRGYIGNFGNACLQHDGDAGFGCACFCDTRSRNIGSAFRHAPEMVGGRPTGPANSVWQMGLMLAELLLGEMPVEHILADHLTIIGRLPEEGASRSEMIEELRELDNDVDTRDVLREVIADELDVNALRGIEHLPPLMRRLLAGMLERDEAERLSAAEALRQTERILADLGDVLLPEASLPRLPSQWFDKAS